MADSVNPQGLKAPFGAFSHAAWAPPGRLLCISGQVATDADGKVVGDDIRTQTRQVCHNIGRILDSVGGAFDDIVAVNVFVTDMRHLAAIHEVRREFFRPPYPASTLVQVAALVDPRYLIEINALAVIRQPTEA